MVRLIPPDATEPILTAEYECCSLSPTPTPLRLLTLLLVTISLTAPPQHHLFPPISTSVLEREKYRKHIYLLTYPLTSNKSTRSQSSN